MKQLQDFDLGILVPIAGRWDDFQGIFPEMEPCCRRNGIEVILVIPQALSASVLEYVKGYPFIDWKVLTGDTAAWNRPAAINSAIRSSEKQYVCVWQPEMPYVEDVMAELREALRFYEGHYAVAEGMGSWCLMARREHLIRIGGYDEQCGALSDENLQRRLELAGIRRLSVPLSQKYPPRVPRQTCGSIKPETLLSCLLPVEALVNETSWGMAYSRLVYNWRDCPFAREQCLDYLSHLEDFELGNNAVFDKSYPLIALIPTYNESERIEGCLRSVEKYCDGIIVLDDESTDDTYQKICSDKLLLKARKKRMGFNDKENRNILLDIAYFFRAGWFIFMDADERFDDRFVDVREVIRRDDVDVAGVWIANLWDDENMFRTDMKDTHPFSQNGLWFRWRMFRNKGRMLIQSENLLHFRTVPYLCKECNNQTLLVHYGYIDLLHRQQKYDFYEKEDLQSLFFYDDIIAQSIMLDRIADVTINKMLIK